MNNFPFRKKIENAASCSDIRFLNYPEKACKLAETPNSLDIRVFDQDLIKIEMRK